MSIKYFAQNIEYNLFMKIFADRLKELREEAGLSQKAMAKKLDISSGAYCYYETNVNEPSIVVLKKIADYFDVTADYLLGRTDY